MTYQQALTESKRVGTSKSEGLAWLAAVCCTLSQVHAVNPRLVFDGARKRGLDGDAVRKLGPVALGDLMFA